MRLLISIHDVMPATLGSTRRIFDRLDRAGLLPVTLLVVPGTGWDEAGLAELRALCAAGGELAGHGWTHRARHVRGPGHRLHAAVISRTAAEHLALSPAAIARLIRRNHRWFARTGLPAPTLYVPPAWAMGPVPKDWLHRLPFDRYETLSGIYEAGRGKGIPLPMIGFEADTAARAAFVRPFNALNRALARRARRPLRVAIHPQDFELRLADSLAATIAAGGEAMSYSMLAVPDGY